MISVFYWFVLWGQSSQSWGTVYVVKYPKSSTLKTGSLGCYTGRVYQKGIPHKHYSSARKIWPFKTLGTNGHEPLKATGMY